MNIKLILKWIAGVMLSIAGLGALGSGGISTAIFYIIGGVVCLPPSLDFIETKLNMKFQTWQKYAAVIGGIFIGGLTVPESMRTNKTVASANNSTSKAENNNANKTQLTTSEEEESKVDYKKIGDEIKVGNFIYRVDGVKFKKELGNEFMKETADGIFLLVPLSIINVSKESRMLDNSLFKLTDDKGTEYESSNNGTTAVEMSGGKTLFLKQCQPNIQTSGMLVFEVPSKAIYNLQLSGGFWKVKTASVKLTE